MGMYTGLRGWIEIKEEYQDFFKTLNDPDFSWFNLNAGVKTIRYAQLDRSYFIPRGAVCYMEVDWKENHINYDGETLWFTCSLKNYEDEIDHFMAALPEFATRWQLEERYEESEFSTFHVYKFEDK